MMRGKNLPWDDWSRVKMAPSTSKAGEYIVEGFDDDTNRRYSRYVKSAARQCFGIKGACEPSLAPAGRISKRGRLRLAYRELVVRFDPKVGEAQRERILGRLGFRVLEASPFTEGKNQWIATHDGREFVGDGLYEAAKQLAELEEVDFAWPNLASEYRREAAVPPMKIRWWLDAINVTDGNGDRLADVGLGSPDVVIAIVDDGVDLSHPNLKNRVVDLGRDFTDTKNPSEFEDANPKIKLPNEDNDVDFHGTACAGIAVSDGTMGQMFGVAPGCKFLSVRALNGGSPVNDTTAAAAIRYATDKAHVIVCAWTADDHVDIENAIAEAATGREGKGVPVFCAAGNEGGQVGYPAALDTTIAVGACTSTGSADGNVGPELHIVAPSKRGDSNLFTTDNQGAEGKNPGGSDHFGDEAGNFWNNFSGTSVATAMAAGVGALCLSVNPKLKRDDLRDLLQRTAANKVGTHKFAAGANLGSGIVDAAAAVAEARPKK